MHDELVGRVAAILRYPVKSMAAEPLESADVSWNGLPGDRRWAFVRPDLERNGFPWLTLRQRNDLNAYRPRWVDPTRPDRSAVLVRTPTDAELEITSPELAQELGAQVMKLDRGAFDSMPLSLVSTRTVTEIGTLAGTPADVLRFRPNLVVEPIGDDAFPEDAWVGATLRVGGMTMRVDRRDKRCVVINIDPATGHRSPEVLKAVARHRDTCLGVYGSVVAPGPVTVGSPVFRAGS
ncbi:MOSC N-terminal beta barrel domain-containing protein [Kineosporia sp. NBRC 101731]|uniref:MOSC domain-containing protein n=1 Tax=Kineosporia sp. NBRC 101731 TaxID=3032199 RepID=UPI00249FC408|nr:MOSC N-terminal beta barrel domain-containing protein [Kineosporia sp. NBRC 101731]GLY29091.1 molybdenum cofactor sulfurase [Kineosporia sp. NBRC 101731]